MSFIFLVRHGRPLMPDNRTYCLGRGSNPSLSETGQRQAKALAHSFDGLIFSHIYCSSLKRSQETAELLTDGRWPVCIRQDLDEINVGLWEGRSFDEIRADDADLYDARGKDWSLSPPGGESLEEAADRIEQAIREMAEAENAETEKVDKASGDLLVVTHDGLIRALLWKLMGLDTKRDAMIRLPYGSITVLHYEDGKISTRAIGRLPENFHAEGY